MYKLLISISIILLFNACGVDTSSSSSKTSSANDNNTSTDDDWDWYGDGYIIDPNPIDGTLSDDNSTSDDNTSDDDTSDGSSDDDLSQEDSYFDISGAEYDEFACIIGDPNNGYTDKKITDDSIDDRSTMDLEYGVSVNSMYPISNVGGNEVSIYYYSLKPSLVGTIVNIYHDSLYRLSIDKAWASNDETKIYVMTPADLGGYPSCYRYDLSTIDENTYQRTKVYREK